jgi:hypothetical protein
MKMSECDNISSQSNNSKVSFSNLISPSHPIPEGDKSPEITVPGVPRSSKKKKPRKLRMSSKKSKPER